MDYADIADITRHDSWEHFLKNRQKGRLVLLTTDADATLWDFKFEPTDFLVMGRESAGVPEDVHNMCDARVKIPLMPQTRSLNVAMCAGMAVSEALRQTRHASPTQD
jgi:tRNA (cytidine/uridine-2'-O-)-methyltransferase